MNGFSAYGNHKTEKWNFYTSYNLNNRVRNTFGHRDVEVRYFDISGTSPVMMTGGKVLSKDFPAITHVDGSARVQTLSQKDNESFYKLVKSFHEISGFPIILNTSFNLPGEPIVENPTDALKSFSYGSLRYLCIGNYLESRASKSS